MTGGPGSGDLQARHVLHPCERALLDHLRSIAHGEVLVKVQDGVPVLLIESKKKIKLGSAGEW